jgi:hypothetical protein
MRKKCPVAFCSVALFLLTLTSAAQAPAWQWAKSAGAAFYDNAMSTAVDPSGNCYVVGYFDSPSITFGPFVLTNADNSGNSPDIFIVKYNSSGSVLWAQNVGGIYPEQGTAVETDVFGNCYVAGFFSGSTITFGATTLTNVGGTDMFIAKYDASGNVLWAQRCGGSGSDLPVAISTDGAAGCYVSGSTTSFSLVFGSINLVNNSGAIIPFTAKYDASGNALWAKIGQGNNNTAEVYDASSNLSGDNFITGYFYGTQIVFGSDTIFNPDITGNNTAIFLVKYDVLGNQVWTRTCAGNGNYLSYSVVADVSGNCYITGSFYSPTVIFGSDTLHNAGSINMFLTKYDPAGNVLWTKREGGWFDDGGQALATDASGNVYVAGYFRSTSLNFGFITLTNADVNTFSLDIFIAKYDPQGNLFWVRNVGGIHTDAVNSIAVDASGNSYFAGFFYSPTIAFDASTLTNADNTGNTYDTFIGKLDNTGAAVVGINAAQVSNNAISLFPNPSSGIFHLNIISDNFLRAEIEVYDVLGNIVFKSVLHDKNSDIDLSGNAPGIYFYQVSDKSLIIGTGKIMLE